MNPRQGVLIAMFLTVAVYLLANANASVKIVDKLSGLKQVPKDTPAPSRGGVTDQRPTGSPRFG